MQKPVEVGRLRVNQGSGRALLGSAGIRFSQPDSSGFPEGQIGQRFSAGGGQRGLLEAALAAFFGDRLKPLALMLQWRRGKPVKTGW